MELDIKLKSTTFFVESNVTEFHCCFVLLCISNSEFITEEVPVLNKVSTVTLLGRIEDIKRY